MKRILVLGNCAVDVIAATIDKMPEPGGTIVLDDAVLRPGGCAVNVAMALGRLGIGNDLITRVGEDRLGSFLIDELESVGVGCGRVTIDPRVATPFTFVMLDSARNRSFFHFRGTNDRIRRDDLTPADLDGREFLVAAGAMGMAELDGPALAEIFEAARQRGIVTVLDTLQLDLPRSRWLELLGPTLEHTSVFAPSLPEAERITGLSNPREIATRLLELGASSVAMKLSHLGAWVADAHDPGTPIPARPLQEVVDSTGAGDCFVAGLVTGLARGEPLGRAAALGNAVARRCLQEIGSTDGVPSLDEVLADP